MNQIDTASSQRFDNYLLNEMKKSERFVSKHEKELQVLQQYLKIIDKNRHQNLEKMKQLLNQNKYLDDQQKQKSEKIQKKKYLLEQSNLFNHKESDFLKKLDSYWSFQENFYPNADELSKSVYMSRKQLILYYESQLEKTNDTLEKNSIKQKILNIQEQQAKYDRNRTIDNKIQKAETLKTIHIDQSIKKFQRHDQHIQDVIKQNQIISEQKQLYFSEKVFNLSEKQKFIELQNQMKNIEYKEKQMKSEIHRNNVKNNFQHYVQEEESNNVKKVEDKLGKIIQLDQIRQVVQQNRAKLVVNIQQQKNRLINVIESKKQEILLPEIYTDRVFNS